MLRRALRAAARGAGRNALYVPTCHYDAQLLGRVCSLTRTALLDCARSSARQGPVAQASQADLFALRVRHKVTVPSSSGGAGASDASERRKRLKPKLSKDKFAALTSAFFERVEAAVAPLQPPMNADFVLERDANGIMTIRTNAKEFEIKVVPLKQQLHFTSPISGLRAYEWNARTQRWEDENDSHDIEGLLTRDLMRICTGIPSF